MSVGFWSTDTGYYLEISCHSLFFDLVGSGACHVPCVCLRLAAVPQVDESLAYTEQYHGDSGAQAAAVTGYLQQVALHLHLSPHAIQTPVTWGKREQSEDVRLKNVFYILGI